MAMDTHATGIAGAGAHRPGDETALDLSLLLNALQSARNGDFSVRLPSNLTGLAGKVADTFNDFATANDELAKELKRISESIGLHGRTRDRLRCERRTGSWGAIEAAVNNLM